MPVLRVAHLLEFPTVAGGERSLLALLGAIDRTRIASTIVAPGEGPLADAVATLGLSRVDSLADAAPVDVVHANSLTTAIRIADAVSSTPSIAHVRDIMRLGRDRLDALLVHDAIVAVSEATAEALVDQGIPRDRVRVIYNGIDVAPVDLARDRRAIRGMLGLDDDAPIVGNVGQVCLRKGQDVFLDAAARIAADDPTVHFVVLGARFSRKSESVEFERALRARSARAPLAGRVHWPGWQPNARRWIAAFDVLAHAAHQEPLGRVLLEALAAGTAIVATDVGGTREILDETMGRIVPPGDPNALAAGIRETLGEPTFAAENAVWRPATELKIGSRWRDASTPIRPSTRVSATS